MNLIVSTKYGNVQGKEEEDYAAFLGIPYAKPPVGKLRWQEPQPPEPWGGIRAANRLGAPALQAPSQSIPGGDPAERGVFGDDSEDCLYLNVWTPDVNGRYPVFVWIHGGAFCCGSGGGKSASPEPFCRRGIVYVTFNYRLGLMGYFAHPELSEESSHGVSGNYAHFDQIAALRWGQENIAAFGGDPDRVTVGGCSAGAGSTQVLCCSPLAEGLFQRAVIESSVGFASAEYPEDFKLETLEQMERRGVEYMEKVGCTSVEEMRHLSYEELISFEDCHFRRKYHYGTTMGVNQDGYLLPLHYRYAMEQGKNRDIPYLVGNTHDEGGGFVLGLTAESFHQKNLAVFGGACGEYEAMCGAKFKEDMVRSMRETHLRLAGAKVFAEQSADAGRSPVYVFDFCRKDPEKGLTLHGFETHYLLGTYRQLPGMTKEDDLVAETMQEYWCRFISDGDPNGEGLPKWPPYSADRRAVLYLDSPCTVGEDQDREPPLMTFAREFLVKKRRENSSGETEF
ncbi:carboxylesterase family protein [Cuneatibacter sp. NSJ-177]|uniref:carboxylesterase/lipase family protein n=1 Tax=Cuneatibacter sp. NSJ-177 TaxID=2931401 RepID=UPI001FD29C40|nr:carboxylesterase family protein [Cuneatibacter sp. NSJ-177]MCJ7833939.1 carboxylesterase family protein [Cuneatibacter sp. NSJ-177]